MTFTSLFCNANIAYSANDKYDIYYHNFDYEQGTTQHDENISVDSLFNYTIPNDRMPHDIIGENIYRFSGWYLKENFEGEPKTYVRQDDANSNREIHLYAKWQQQIRLTGKINVTNDPNFIFDINSPSDIASYVKFYSEESLTKETDAGKFISLDAEGNYEAYVNINSNLYIRTFSPFKPYFKEITTEDDDKTIDIDVERILFSSTLKANLLYEGEIISPNFKIQFPTSSSEYDKYLIYYDEEEVRELSSGELDFPNITNISKVKVIQDNNIYIESIDQEYLLASDLINNRLSKPYIPENSFIYFGDTGFSVSLLENEPGSKNIFTISSTNGNLVLIDQSCNVSDTSYLSGNYSLNLIKHIHDFSNVYYEFFYNNTKCKATATCTSEDTPHEVAEIVDTTFIPELEPTNFDDGTGYYHAHFENELFEDQYTDTLYKDYIPFEINDELIDLDDGSEYIIHTNGIYQVGAAVNLLYEGEPLIYKEDYDYYFVNGLTIYLLSSFVNKAKTGTSTITVEYSLDNYETHDRQEPYIDSVDIYKSPTTDEADLYISYDEDNYVLYLDGDPYPHGSSIDELLEKIDVSNEDKLYTVTLKDNLDLETDSGPVILTNDDVSLILDGNVNRYKLNLSNTDDFYHSDVISVGGDLTINNFSSITFDEVPTFFDYIYDVRYYLETSFISTLNGDITINNSNINVSSYHTLLSANVLPLDGASANIYINYSNIDHTLYPSTYSNGSIYSITANNNVHVVETVINSKIDFNSISEDYEVAFNGIEARNGDILIEYSSEFNFEGNPHHRGRTYSAYALNDFTLNNSSFKSKDTTLGIYALNNINFDNPKLVNIDCKYGALVSESGDINLNLNTEYINEFILNTYTTGIVYGNNVNAVKVLDNEHKFNFDLISENYYLNGTIDGEKYYSLDTISDDALYSLRRIELSDTEVLPDIDTVDLYISFDENNFVVYENGVGSFYGPSKNNYEEYLDVIPSNDSNSYKIILNNDKTLKSKDGPVILTNNGISFVIDGNNYSLNLERASYTNHSDVISISGNLDIDNVSNIEYSESLANYGYAYTASTNPNSSFIKSLNGYINISNSNINVENYHSLIVTNSLEENININSSTINQTLLPSPFGFVNSIIANNNIEIIESNLSLSYNGDLTSEQYKVNYCGILSNNGNVYIKGDSNFDFEGNLYSSLLTYVIKSGKNTEIRKTSFASYNSTLGILSHNNILIKNPTLTNIDCKYGSLVSEEGFIKLIFETRIPNEFVLNTSTTGIIGTQEVNAVKVLGTGNKCFFEYQLNAENRFLNGTIDGIEYVPCNDIDTDIFSLRRIELMDTPILPDIDEADLYISFDEDNYAIYENYSSAIYGPNKDEYNDLLNVEYNVENNSYLISFDKDTTLKTGNGPVILTNNDVSLSINGNGNSLNIERSDYVDHFDIISVSGNIDINNISEFNYSETFASQEYINTISSYPNSSFIKSLNGYIHISDSIFNVSNYHSLLNSNKNIIINNSPKINHTLLPSQSGYITSIIANNDVEVDNSNIILSYEDSKTSEDYKVNYSGIISNNGNVSIRENSNLNFVGNYYNNVLTYAIRSFNDTNIINSGISSKNTTVGIRANNDISIENPISTNIDCIYGALVSENGDIILRLDDKVPGEFVLNTSKTGIINNINVNAVKALNSENNFSYILKLDGYYLNGTIDYDEYYSLEKIKDDKEQLYSLRRIELSDSPIIPDINEADLYISFDEENYVVYEKELGIFCGPAKDKFKDLLNIHYDSKSNLYNISLKNRTFLKSKDGPVILTNNNVSLVIEGSGHSLTLEKANYNNYSNIINVSGDIQVRGVQPLAYFESSTNSNHTNSLSTYDLSFIKSVNGNITIEKSGINIENHHSLFNASGSKGEVRVHGSKISQTLLPSATGNVTSIIADSTVEFTDYSAVILNYKTEETSEEYKINYSGIISNNGDVLINNSSHYEFDGNYYNNLSSYAIKSGKDTQIIKSYIKSINTTIGIRAKKNILIKDPEYTNIECKYGALISDKGAIDLKFIENFNNEFVLSASSTGIIGNQEVNVVKNLSSGKEYYFAHEISSSDYFLNGTVDGIEYSSIDDDDDVDVYSLKKIILMDCPVVPNIDNVDLYISLDENSFITYIDGKRYPYNANIDEVDKMFDVTFDGSNIYTINLKNDLKLVSKDTPIIVTNNDKSIVINGNKRSIAFIRYDVSDRPDIISISGNIDINNVLDVRYSDEHYDNKINIIPTFIRSLNGHIVINESNLYVTNRGSLLSANHNKSFVKIIKSDIEHTLCPTANGVATTITAEDSVEISESNISSKYLSDISSEDYKVNFNGIIAKDGSVTIDEDSKFDFEGNYYHNGRTYAIKSGYYTNIVSSNFKSKYTTIGILSNNNILIQSPSSSESNYFDIDCKYGALVSENGAIDIIFDDNADGNFNINTNQIGKINDTDVKAIKFLGSGENCYFNYNLGANDRFLIGTTDGDEYISIDKADIDSFKQIMLSDVPAKPDLDEANLVIHDLDGDNTLLYLNEYKFGNDIENLEVIHNIDREGGRSSYTIKLTGGNAYVSSTDDDCIYTNGDFDLNIEGQGTLNIIVNSSYNKEQTLYGVKCSEGKLTIGETHIAPVKRLLKANNNEDNRTTINVYDLYNPQFRRFFYEKLPTVNSFYSNNGINIYNSEINSYNYGNMFINNSLDNPVIISNTDIVHNFKGDGLENDDIYSTIYSVSPIYVNDNSIIRTSFESDFNIYNVMNTLHSMDDIEINNSSILSNIYGDAIVNEGVDNPITISEDSVIIHDFVEEGYNGELSYETISSISPIHVADSTVIIFSDTDQAEFAELDGLCTDDEIVIDNSTISAFSHGNLLDCSGPISIINNSDVLHSFADDGYENENSYSTISSLSSLTINDSKLYSSIESEYESSDVSLMSILTSGSINIYNSDVTLNGNINSDACLGIFDFSIDEDSTITIEDSILHISNVTMGITAIGPRVEFINSDIDFETSNASIASLYPVNITVNNDNYLDKFKLHRKDNYSFDSDDCYPIIYVADDEYYDDPVIATLPNDYSFQYSLDDEYYTDFDYELKDLYSYASIRFTPNPDLTINNNNKSTMYFDGNKINGPDIPGLDITRNNVTYNINLTDNVNLESNRNSAIEVSNYCSLNITGNYELSLDVTNNIMDPSIIYLYGIKACADLTIGDKGESNHTIVTINDPYSKDNDDFKQVNSVIFGLDAEGDINIYNTELIGNISGSLLQAKDKINIDNSSIEHYLYANYSGISGQNELIPMIVPVFTINSKQDEAIIKNSEVISTYKPSNEYINLELYGIFAGKNIDIDDSNVNIDSYIDIDKELNNDYQNKYALSTTGSVDVNDSSITVDNCTYGIFANQSVNFTNSKVDIRTYGYSILVNHSLNITYNNDYIPDFTVESTNPGEVNIENNIQPSIIIFDLTIDKVNLNVPTNYLFKDKNGKAIVGNDLFKNKYCTIALKKPDPINPPNPPYNPPYTPSKPKDYNVPGTGIEH